MESQMASQLSYSFGYWWVKANVAIDYSSNSKTSSQTHHIIATMRIERYYSSIREELSPLNAAATELLNRQDYIGFFKACGPNYIRGIRRAQEVTAVFTYRSSSLEIAKQYSASVQVAYPHWGDFTYGSSYTEKSKFNSINRSLKIKILGYGLGLSDEGSETLVATSLAEYQRVMRFAYHSMTRSEGAAYIGMVYGLEVVPWVENVNYQVASGLQDEAIEIPLARSLIPRAYKIADPTDTEFDNANRALFRCKSPAYEMDQYGYCCEAEALYDQENEEYDPTEPESRYCRPIRSLDKAIVSENMASNGELVARLDRMVRYKMNQLSTLERCISAARAIPERFNAHILKSMDSVKYDESIDIGFTVLELKMALDPFNDFSMVKHMAREIDEYIEMFYQPCLAALFGTNVGLSSDTDPIYFMAYPWHTHKECLHLSCFGNGMRWDREKGGCVPGLITGTTSVGYKANDKHCAKDVEGDEEDEICKYTSGILDQYHTDAMTCWETSLPAGRIDYFMDHFCMPSVTSKKLNDEEAAELLATTTANCRLDCVIVTFETSGSDSSEGPFDITGYGRLPTSCHDAPGAKCDVRLCGMDTMEITAKTETAWAFTITKGIVHQGEVFPIRMDTDEYVPRQEFKLDKRVGGSSSQSIVAASAGAY